MNWMVTRSLVSYVQTEYPVWFLLLLNGHQIIGELRPGIVRLVVELEEIEWSPDHWWVTSVMCISMLQPVELNGHQIIGELRLYNSV